MKQIQTFFAAGFIFIIAVLLGSNAFAQKQVEVNGHDVGSWFSTHWMWIAGGVILLLIILFGSGGSSRRKSTTVVKDMDGNVKSVTTTEDV